MSGVLMWPGEHAETRPDHAAIIMAGSGETVTYAELDRRSCRLANLLRKAGFEFGDHVAVLMENHPRFLEVTWAAQRSGLYYTAVNSHFNADEVAYILKDCGARGLITSYAMRDVAALLVDQVPGLGTRLMMDGAIEGYDSYEDATAAQPDEPIADELEGHAMLYSSGTTGTPKGIRYQLERRPMGTSPIEVGLWQSLYGVDPDDVFVTPAPLYHSAPLQFSMMVHRIGGTVLVLERFEPEGALAAIERYHATHGQWVPTMFSRMLKLPAAVREHYDVSSLRGAIHVAAPCPIPVKEAMIEWWGPILIEYYAATEAIGLTLINSEEWLQHKGSVGKSILSPVHILDEEGHELGVGEEGEIFFEPMPFLSFEYHNDSAKTAAARNENGWATVGDVGRVDADGYLYLTDRIDFMIVSGGVNIYPQEAENVLVTHPKVLDCAVFGVPDEDMGEAVKAVVQPVEWADAGPALEEELLDFCRSALAHYKCPRTIDFLPDLPREETGKLYKRLLREPYWTGRDTRIV